MSVAGPKETEDGGLTPASARAPMRLNELVHSALRAHIRDGAFDDGLVLREKAVAEVFGVGRAPARMALKKLESESLVRKRQGHGFIVARRQSEPECLHLPLLDAGLVLPKTLDERLAKRNWRQHIYPTVERTVASCLIFGRFRINQSALADHFGVSRTVAHEVLTSLEKVGFVSQGKNARWYAGPITVQDLKESYELRWLLEPQALRQAAATLPRETLLAARRQHQRVLDCEVVPDPEVLNDIELALHTEIVLQCANRRMRDVLRNCQLPIIVTYGTVVRSAKPKQLPSGVPETLVQHLEIIDLLLDGEVEAAARKLETHIRSGFQYSLPHFISPPPLTPDRIPPYMVFEV